MSGIDAAGLGAPAALALAGAVFLLAGAVKGVVGLGLPTISMALLALLMPPAQAAALLIVPSLVTNLWQAGPLASLRRVWRRIAGMQAGVGVGTLGGAWWFGAPAGAWAAGALGAALLAYAGWGLLGRPPRVPARAQPWLGPLVGALTGLVTAATGVFVVPAVPYLQALGLDKDELVQAMGISFSVSTLALAAGLGLTGHYGGGAAAVSLAMLAPALAGMVCGQRLRHALSPQRFRLCLYASLALLGAYQIVQAR
ncbi:sulfite exporter TauE/SafE family protein [Bordetella bronchiseptica]|uniref:sulfite exporter TauE/SafE family protein n=1 Tax=Bordetella bronchiseptica TaxID=518 RepID=UPI00049FE6C7|nr:sulfite exporter TauE/SafE family protein [Bordetella bronchiseptica]AZW11616.1 sulfite exporter TauE/SafE family protein [Bordetella bronchiseptica]KDC66271.1 sulfite exporter TauE/SafE [Bordetella bronchiseptica MBORD624]KDD62182.1 sulfite exporter TauE/SafE [Bordetella bronchiseptica SO10328]QBS68206.1 anion permease [Bordetella bronchiseptica]